MSLFLEQVLEVTRREVDVLIRSQQMGGVAKIKQATRHTVQVPVRNRGELFLSLLRDTEQTVSY